MYETFRINKAVLVSKPCLDIALIIVTPLCVTYGVRNFVCAQCSNTEGLTAFYSEILHEPTKLAVLGAGCSVSTEATAAVSHFYNIPQVRNIIPISVRH